MVADETEVTVIDLGARARERSRPEGPPPGSPGILEGALLITVGLTTAAIEAVTRSVMSALGETLPPARSDDVEEGRATQDAASETAAMLAGATLGLAVEACRTVTRAVAALDRALKPMSLVASIPFVDRAAQRLERAADGMNDTWRGDRTESMAIAEAFADALVPDLVEAMVAHLNLTDLVLERVDLDEVVARVDLDAVVDRIDPAAIVDRLDLDAVAARIDVEKILERLDLVAIAEGVIDELDLSAIIRESTETMATETVGGVRAQSVRADRLVAHVLDRALFRRDRGDTERSSEPGAFGSTEDDP
jgi:hypothetical protein